MGVLDNVTIGMMAEQIVTVTSEMTVGHFLAQMPSPRGDAGWPEVCAVARVVTIDAKSVVFEVEAWDGGRKIGDSTHRRGIVNVVERYGVRQLAVNSD
jgi:fluoroacetyl-CoA thioesterase